MTNRHTKAHGDSFRDILLYWAPELVSAAAIFTFPILLDAYFISLLRSTTTYGALGVANNFLHLLAKFAEVIQVAAMVVVGRHNGAHEYEKGGRALGDTFWATIAIGFVPALLIFFFSTQIYLWLNVPAKMAVIGAPFLKFRALALFFQFLYFAFFGFMRGVKNTRTPMFILIAGQIVFLLFDYVLIFGAFGFPEMRLAGSALASIIQNVFMVAASIVYILTSTEYKKYFPTTFFYLFSTQGILSILNLCWQIAIDKTALAFAYIQLQKMIGGLGKYAIASFSVIKDLERLAMLPAIAFATVLTFLVSNSLGAQDPEAARANIKKTLIMAAIFVSTLLIIMCLMPATFVTIFDQKNKFTDLAAKVFPFISLLVVFDFIQLLLAASLRGARDVGYVMLVRAGTCYLFFWPIGWWIAGAPMWPLDLLLPPLNITNETLKFILIYGFFYVNNGLMGLLFLARVKFKKQHPLRQATQA